MRTVKHNIYKDRLNRIYMAGKCTDGMYRIVFHESHDKTWRWYGTPREYKTILKAQWNLDCLAVEKGWTMLPDMLGGIIA